MMRRKVKDVNDKQQQQKYVRTNETKCKNKKQKQQRKQYARLKAFNALSTRWLERATPTATARVWERAQVSSLQAEWRRCGLQVSVSASASASVEWELKCKNTHSVPLARSRQLCLCEMYANKMRMRGRSGLI